MQKLFFAPPLVGRYPQHNNISSSILMTFFDILRV